MLYDFHACLELLPAPQNCLAPRGQGLNFQRLFMMVAVPLFLPRWFVQLQSESGVLVFWKCILFVFVFKLE